MGCDDRRYIDRSRYRFSIHATRRQHTRVLPLLVIASWLGCFLDTGSGLSSETDVAVVFVDVYQGSSERTCGSEANPCDLVSRALDHVNLVNHSTILINLSATRRGSENFVQPDRVDSRSNIIVNGMAAGIISVEYNKSPADPNAIWLDFVNCSYVTIQHLQLNLENFTGDSAVAFRSSMSCSVENSMFMYAPLNCSTIKVMNTWPFQALQVLMHGKNQSHPAPPPADQWYTISTIAIEVNCSYQTCLWNRSAINNVECCASRAALNDTATQTFSISDCQFKHLGILRPNIIYYHDGGIEGGTAITMYAEHTLNMMLDVVDTLFFGNISPFDTTVKIDLDNGCTNGRLHFIRCRFEYNEGYIGGGITYFVNSNGVASNHQLILKDSTLDGNWASLEGGALTASIADGNSSIEVVVIINCTFTNNVGGTDLTSGLIGGALSITSSSVALNFYDGAPMLRVTNSTFKWNRAVYGSAIYLKGMEAILDTVTMTGQIDGSCIHTSVSRTTLCGQHFYSNNKDSDYGGVFSLYDFSRLAFEDNINITFENNSALVGGGILYADETSSTPDISQHIFFSTDIGEKKDCFLATSGLATFQYNGTSSDGKVTFRNNTAKFGSAILANSYSGCLKSAMLSLNQTSKRTEIGRSSGNVASGPVWMFLASTTSPCLKPLITHHDHYWHIPTQCDRQILQQAYQESNYTLLYELMGELEGFINGSFLFRQNVSGAAVFPSGDYFFLMPWTSTPWRWYYPRKANNNQEKTPWYDAADGTLVNTSHLGNLTLYPAPGEVFRIDVDLADVYFNLVTAACILKVDSGDALIQHGGYQYSRTDIVNFGTLNTLAIALVGKPGTVGTLRLSVDSQIRSNTFMSLIIPFRLSPCHLGYKPTAMMENLTWAKEYIDTFTLTRMDFSEGPLACQCLHDTAGVHSCKDGADVTMQWEYWAGTTEEVSYLPAAQRGIKLITDLAADEERHSRLTFATGACTMSYCTDHNRTNWQLQEEWPCSPHQHRSGLLCGQCEQGYYLTGFFSSPCTTCSASTSIRNTFFLFVGVFIYIGAIIAILAYFQVGRTSWFDSWVNYDQMCAFIIRRQIPMTTFTTFSLPICMRWLTPSLQVCLLYLTTVAILLWITLIFQLSRLGSFRRTFHTSSLTPTLWAMLNFCFASSVFPSFLLLSCHSFNNNYVFFSDARVKCGSARHAPYIVTSVLVLGSICVALPVVLYVKRNTPRVKPLFDVYLGYVKENRTWWIFYNMLRRVVVAVLSAMIDNESLVRQILLAAIVLVMIIIQYFTKPYKKDTDNAIEFLCLSNAALFAVVNLPSPSDVNDNYTILLWVVFGMPTPILVGYAVYLNREKLKETLPSTGCWNRAKYEARLATGNDDTSEATPLTTSEQVRVKKWSLQTKPGELRDDLLIDT